MMTSSKDNERKEALIKHKASMTEEEERARRYQQFLMMSRTENFTDLTATGAFYRAGLSVDCLSIIFSFSGVDYQGCQVVVYVDRLFPATKFDLNKVNIKCTDRLILVYCRLLHILLVLWSQL